MRSEISAHVATSETCAASEAAINASDNDATYSLEFGVTLGFIIGWILGLAQLFYFGVASFQYAGLAATIPLGSGLGWAIYGGILGGAGIFCRKHGQRVEHEGEEISMQRAA